MAGINKLGFIVIWGERLCVGTKRGEIVFWCIRSSSGLAVWRLIHTTQNKPGKGVNKDMATGLMSNWMMMVLQ